MNQYNTILFKKLFLLILLYSNYFTSKAQNFNQQVNIYNGHNLFLWSGNIIDHGNLSFISDHDDNGSTSENSITFRGSYDVRRLYIHHNGHVGIGNFGNPESRLHIYDEVSDAPLLKIHGKNPGIVFRLININSSPSPSIEFPLRSTGNQSDPNRHEFTFKNPGVGGFVFMAGPAIDERVRITPEGYVGIGIQLPNAKLSLGNDANNSKFLISEGMGEGSFGIGYQQNQFRFHLGNNSGKFSFLATPGGNDIVNIDGTGNLWTQGNMTATGNVSTQGNMTASGKVSVFGAVIPSGYHLAVKGGIICQELKIKYSGQWPDKVFRNSYILPSLEEVEAYYKVNKHLKDVPSEEEIKLNGILTGEMDATLLKKIEELTIYLVEINKEVKALQEKNKHLELQLQQR